MIGLEVTGLEMIGDEMIGLEMIGSHKQHCLVQFTILQYLKRLNFLSPNPGSK